MENIIEIKSELLKILNINHILFIITIQQIKLKITIDVPYLDFDFVPPAFHSIGF